VGTPPKYAKARTWPSRNASVISAGNAATKQSSESDGPRSVSASSAPRAQPPPALRRSPPLLARRIRQRNEHPFGRTTLPTARSPSRSCSRQRSRAHPSADQNRKSDPLSPKPASRLSKSASIEPCISDIIVFRIRSNASGLRSVLASTSMW
jgi:hypothetical protein